MIVLREYEILFLLERIINESFDFMNQSRMDKEEPIFNSNPVLAGAPSKLGKLIYLLQGHIGIAEKLVLCHL